jgi:glutathione-regulated potassium-efflux system ancillary protein KefG
MVRVLIVFAHPALEKSRVHRRLLAATPRDARVTLHDLYQEYPDFDIDVDREQRLLLDHDVIVLQHPLYWYSGPPLLKEWLDLVLEHGWAYGSEGDALHGKVVLQAISAGGGASAYCEEGYNRYTIRQYLRPFEGTVRLCGMTYLPPWVVFGTHRLDAGDIEAWGDAWSRTVGWLLDEGYRDLETDPDALLVEGAGECAPWPPRGVPEGVTPGDIASEARES